MKLENNVFIFNSKHYNILIVEDTKSINKVLTNTFKNEKYNTFSVFNLKDANDILEHHRIDFIMLDVHLPDGNGFELIKRLENSHEKIFVLSSESDNQFRSLTYEKGIIDYILKDKDFYYYVKKIPNNIENLISNRFKTILVIDDSIVVQEQLKDILINRLYKVIVCSNTKEAQIALSEEKIDLIMLNIELKNENGLDFLKNNKNEILNKKEIPVIIISGNMTSYSMRDALRSGAIDIINKPYILEELVLKVDLWIDYKRKKEEIIESKKLLEEYKHIVDENSIVSKTDLNGIITYVNNNFCELSGYSRKELIGKKHNLVRHEDMSSSVYKDLWHSIKVLKKSWTGNIKNISKYGSIYWVKSTIKPILNSKGQVIEYISIRNDITEDMQVKQYFEHKLNNTNHNLKDAISLAKSYEIAINESNMLCRLDLNFNYTYVNNKFCKFTSFSRKELIGKKHSIIIHKDIHKSNIFDIEKSLKTNNIWNGIIHNKSKKNKEYWVKATALPIKDKNEKIIEYLIIRYDVSELFELHKEIEDTQRELIYRMGEVGESRSKETGNHVKRVATYSKELALLYGLNDEESQKLFIASPMHDIGKVGIADSILKKPGKLTAEEFEIMKTHSDIGYNILKDSNKPILEAAAIVALTHHEKWDGSGYPKALKGKDIHIFGRITAIADVFDALGSDRVYKKAWKDNDIFKLFQDQKGKHFDPVLIDLFLDNKSIFLEIRSKYVD